MSNSNPTPPSYEELRNRLAEAEEVIRVLRSGEVDAIISERDLALVRLRATEETLRKLTMELEERVRDRTMQLEDAKQKLEKTMNELRSAQVRLLETERLTTLATLAAAVAHEVNNPLMGVLNAVGYARRTARDPDILQALQDAEEGLQRMTDIVRNLLGFVRPRAELEARAEIPLVIDRTLAFLGADLEARGIRVTTDIASPLPSVIGPEGRLQQVLTNLLTNARDALADCAEKKIHIRAYRKENAVRLEVQDSGPGVPADVRDQLFKPFFTTKPGLGTGLGLPVSKSIVEDVGGALTLESPPGQGARFVATLQSVSTEGKGLPEEVSTAPKRILVVDDDKQARLAFVYALKGTPYELDSAVSGPEALEKAKAQRFDLVFLDLKMPEMDGVETLRRLRQIVPDVPVYIVTAFHETFMQRLSEAIREGLRFGVVEKPLGSDRILSIVRSMLEGPQAV